MLRAIGRRTTSYEKFVDMLELADKLGVGVGAVLELGQLLAGPGEHVALHLEFLAGHQIELGKAAGEQGTGIFLQIAGRTVGKQLRHFGADFVEDLRIGHGRTPVHDRGHSGRPGARSECSTGSARRDGMPMHPNGAPTWCNIPTWCAR